MRHQVARQSDLDPRVPDFLDALSQGRITIALARKGETQALVWPAAADAPLAQRLRHHLHVPGQQQLQALQQTLPELMELMELMTECWQKDFPMQKELENHRINGTFSKWPILCSIFYCWILCKHNHNRWQS